MQTKVSLPLKPFVIESGKNRGVFEIRECWPGYGITLGNAMRRVLLSSLPGAAVTGFKIKGVSHEFSTIPFVMEGVVDIILNLKCLRFKSFSEEPVALTLSVKGKKDVTGKDIKLTSEVELINQNAPIATITDKKGELEMELIVEKGLGFIPVESVNKDKLEIGMIAIDAAFTPIVKVNYTVENMRVGDKTDYNLVRFEIETDGSITPEEAFMESAKILVDHFKMLSSFVEEEEVSEQEDGVDEDGGEEKKSKKKDIGDVTKVKVEDLKLPTRIINVLIDNGIKTVGGLSRKSEEDLSSIEGMGGVGVKEIKKIIGRFGITLKK